MCCEIGDFFAMQGKNRYNYSGEKSGVKTRKLHPAVKKLEYPVLAADSKLS